MSVTAKEIGERLASPDAAFVSPHGTVEPGNSYFSSGLRVREFAELMCLAPAAALLASEGPFVTEATGRVRTLAFAIDLAEDLLHFWADRENAEVKRLHEEYLARQKKAGTS